MNSENFRFWLGGFLEGVSGPLTLDHVRKIQDKLASVSGPPPSNPYPYSPLVPSWPYAPSITPVPMPPLQPVVTASGNMDLGPPAAGSFEIYKILPNILDAIEKFEKQPSKAYCSG